MYIGNECSKTSKTANYVALLRIAGTVVICSIRYFIFVPKIQSIMFVATSLKRSKNWSLLTDWKCSQLMRVKDDRYINNF